MLKLLFLSHEVEERRTTKWLSDYHLKVIFVCFAPPRFNLKLDIFECCLTSNLWAGAKHGFACSLSCQITGSAWSWIIFNDVINHFLLTISPRSHLNDWITSAYLGHTWIRGVIGLTPSLRLYIGNSPH